MKPGISQGKQKAEISFLFFDYRTHGTGKPPGIAVHQKKFYEI